MSALAVHGMTTTNSRASVMPRRSACGLMGGSALLFGNERVAAEPATAVPLKTFTDPLFELTYPSDYFSIRRTISGDVVRRGGVIFTAGRLSTAEIVTVERFPISEMLAQADATSFFPEGKISKWSDLGTREALATYVCERRDNEATMAAKGKDGKARASQAIPDSIIVDDDTLQVDVQTDIGSTEMRVGEAGAKAMSIGVRRIQRARLVLLPGGKTVMGCWAGCLDDTWNQGESVVLKDIVASFKPTLSA